MLGLYQEVAPGVRTVPGMELMALMVDGIAFDIDGVLINTEGSYPAVICDVTQRMVSQHLGLSAGEGPALVTPEETRLFKQAGGFNSDWHLAMACIVHYLAQAALLGAPDRMPSLADLRATTPGIADFARSLAGQTGSSALQAAESAALQRLTPDAQAWVRSHYKPEEIARLCCEVYGGGDWCEALFGFAPVHYTGPGFCNREAVVLDPSLLQAAGKKYGIYSGREYKEALPVLQRCGLAEVAPQARQFADGKHVKPDPQGLLAISDHYRLRIGIFVGDNIDDARTVQNYKRQYPGATGFLFCGITSGALGERSAEIFAELGADMIATDVNALLRWLAGR